jgi:hypothetical protein
MGELTMEKGEGADPNYERATKEAEEDMKLGGKVASPCSAWFASSNENQATMSRIQISQTHNTRNTVPQSVNHNSGEKKRATH